MTPARVSMCLMTPITGRTLASSPSVSPTLGHGKRAVAATQPTGLQHRSISALRGSYASTIGSSSQSVKETDIEPTCGEMSKRSLLFGLSSSIAVSNTTSNFGRCGLQSSHGKNVFYHNNGDDLKLDPQRRHRRFRGGTLKAKFKRFMKNKTAAAKERMQHTDKDAHKIFNYTVIHKAATNTTKIEANPESTEGKGKMARRFHLGGLPSL